MNDESTAPTLIELTTFALAGVVISAALLRQFARFAITERSPIDSSAPPDRTWTELGGIAILGMFGFAIVGQAILSRSNRADAPDHVHRALIVTILGHAIVTAIAILYARGRGRRPLEAIGIPPRNHLRDPLHGIATLIATIPAFLSISAINTWIVERLGAAPHQELVDSLMANRGLLDDTVIVLGIGVFGPLFEEILFRGLLLRSLAQVTPRIVAIFGSSLIFALHHDPQSAVPVFLLGFTFGLAYCRTGSIVAPFVAHSLFNLLQLFYVIREGG